MCWNPDISLNTFIFAIFALLFIYLANTYTKYKNVDNLYFYLFFLVVAFVQLMEFFLWRNLKNNDLNILFSRILFCLVIIQPIILSFMIPKTNNNNANVIILFYLIFIIYVKFNNPNLVIRTSIGKNGHLLWEWTKFKNYKIIIMIFLLFYIIPVLLINNISIIIITLGIIFISIYSSDTDGTFGSVWCWVSNVILLFFIIDILLLKPFIEYKKLC
jgi:hypothetical protein